MLELTEKGFISVRIGEVEKQLDAFSTNNKLADIGRQAQGKPMPEYLSAIVDYLAELGWAGCSHWLAGQFVKAITEEVNRLGELDGAEPTHA